MIGIDLLVFLAVGALAGTLAGLLGVGGGLIIVPALAWYLPLTGVPEDQAMHLALGSALASMIFTSASSSLAHARRGAVVWRAVHWLAPGLVLGALAGAFVAALLAATTLKLGFALFCLLVAWQMAFGGVSAAGRGGVEPALLAPAGLGIGSISALVGIGGGSLTVPLLVWRGHDPVRAVATSAACGWVIACAGALGYALAGAQHSAGVAGAVGYLHLPAVLGIALASVFTAPLGARLAHRLPARSLRRIFALFLLLIALLLLRAALV